VCEIEKASQAVTLLSMAVTHVLLFFQVCGGAYTKDRGRYRDTGLQLCYQWAKEGVTHCKFDPLTCFMKVLCEVVWALKWHH